MHRIWEHEDHTIIQDGAEIHRTEGKNPCRREPQTPQIAIRAREDDERDRRRSRSHWGDDDTV